MAAAANVHDVAKYILSTYGEMSTMKLQKLVFYAQAYKLAWLGEPLYPQKVRAWTHGPVVYELFKQHKGRFTATAEDYRLGNPLNVPELDQAVVAAVWNALGDLTGWELRNRTHEEGPWLEAFDPGESWHNEEITHDAMAEYYGRHS